MTGQQLKSSILQMAVQGKLVPQDPNDEPASVLLERIRKEKEQLIKDGKIKKEKNPSYIFRGADNLPYEKVGKNEPVCIADQVPFEIPESWEWVRLGSIFSIEMGQSPAGNTVSENNIGIEFHQGKMFFGDKYINLSGKYTSSPTKYAPKNSVLLCVRAPVGKVNITNRKLCIGRGLCAIIPLAGMPLLFVYYLLAAYENIFVKQATGTTFVAITAETVKNQLIPLPPFAEQIRIAEQIEKLIPVINEYRKVEDNIKKLNDCFPELLKKSILQEAVQGKLVPQDPTDEPASVLLERIRAEKERLIQEGKIKRDKHESVIYRRDNSHYEKLDGIERCIDDEIPFEIPESWAWVRFSNIASFQNGDRSKNYPNRNEYVSNGVAWINTGHITSDGFLNVNTMNYITEEKYNSLSNGHIQKGDLVYCLRGATFGKVARIEPFSKGAIASSLMIIRPFDVSLRNYIYWYLRSPSAYIELHKYSNGSAQPNLAAKDVGKYLVPIPPLDEQIRIINQYIRLLAIIENI